MSCQSSLHLDSSSSSDLHISLALLLDGASARNRVLNTETFAAAIAVVLIDNAIPTAAVRSDPQGRIIE